MTIQELADNYVGHPREIDEVLSAYERCESFKSGAYAALSEIETRIQMHMHSSFQSFDNLKDDLLYFIKELKNE